MMIIPDIRHVLCTVLLSIFFSGWVQAGEKNLSGLQNLSSFDIITDTVRIRLIQQELSQFPYINQQKEYYLQLEQLAQKTGNVSLQAKCCYELANIYMQQSDYPRAIDAEIGRAHV